MPSVALRKPCRRKPSNKPWAWPWLRVGNVGLLEFDELPDGVDVLVVAGVGLLLVVVGAESIATVPGAAKTVVADCACAVAAVSAAHSSSAASTASTASVG